MHPAFGLARISIGNHFANLLIRKWKKLHCGIVSSPVVWKDFIAAESKLLQYCVGLSGNDRTVEANIDGAPSHGEDRLAHIAPAQYSNDVFAHCSKVSSLSGKSLSHWRLQRRAGLLTAIVSRHP
jgi:hypothetical protein